MPSRAVITAKSGPGLQNTTVKINNLTNVNIDLQNRNIQFRDIGSEIKTYDLVGVTTFSVFVSGSNYTFSVL